jgi:hypothetical protein
MKTLNDLEMKELRELAFDLEALTETELKANKKKDLLALVEDALAKVDEGDRASTLSAYGIGAAELKHDEAATLDQPGDIADPVAHEAALESGEIAKLPDEAAETVKAPAPAPIVPYVEPEGAPRVLPYAIQIREHKLGGSYQYGEIVIEPTAELVDSHVHAKLSEEGVRKLQARGTRTRKVVGR